MQGILLIIGIIFALVATATHVLIFVFESVLWSKPKTWRRFGIRTQEDADVVLPMAYNQGFYNLFLALGAALGLALIGWSYGKFGGVWQGGIYVLLFCLACMVLASIVLFSTNRRFWKAVLVQGGAPLIALLFLLVAVYLPVASAAAV